MIDDKWVFMWDEDHFQSNYPIRQAIGSLPWNACFEVADEFDDEVTVNGSIARVNTLFHHGAWSSRHQANAGNGNAAYYIKTLESANLRYVSMAIYFNTLNLFNGHYLSFLSCDATGGYLATARIAKVGGVPLWSMRGYAGGWKTGDAVDGPVAGQWYWVSLEHDVVGAHLKLYTGTTPDDLALKVTLAGALPKDSYNVRAGIVGQAGAGWSSDLYIDCMSIDDANPEDICSEEPEPPVASSRGFRLALRR